MIKIGVADYGLNQWYGKLYDYQDRLTMLKELGYDGLERLSATNQFEAIEISANAKSMGMDFGTCSCTNMMQTIRFSAALGKTYIWAEASASNMDEYCRKVNYQTEAAAKYGVKVGVHNHLGTMVETPAQVDEFLEKCPNSGILLDVGHLAMAGGNPLDVIDKYFDRIVAVHMKDYLKVDPSDPYHWRYGIRFCELGGGEMGEHNKDVLRALIQKGYDGWIYVEHDTHVHDPKIDLKISRDFIRSCGL